LELLPKSNKRANTPAGLTLFFSASLTEWKNDRNFLIANCTTACFTLLHIATEKRTEKLSD
jgi:hypothetical protein